MKSDDVISPERPSPHSVRCHLTESDMKSGHVIHRRRPRPSQTIMAAVTQPR